jgi:hypothetical protein
MVRNAPRTEVFMASQSPPKPVSRTAAADRLIRTLLAACDDPSVALELLYWSREPGLVEVIRAVATMPEETRATVEAFVTLARDMRTVSARLGQNGTLTLESREVTRTAALAEYVAETETDDIPHLLN